MGLIRAAISSVGSTMRDQWLDFFVCDAIREDTLMVRGVRTNKNGRNNGSDNVISNGSGIIVSAGQCAIITSQGAVVELVAEPGEFTWDADGEPSIFHGGLGAGIMNTFKTIGRRIARGGETGRDHRVYYVNIKELHGNKFGTATPLPFRIVDPDTGFRISTTLRGYGTYSWRVADPIKFFTNIAANITDDFKVERLQSQMRSEFLSALQPALGALGQKGILPDELTLHTLDVAAGLNEHLSGTWNELRGFEVVSIAFNSITTPDEVNDQLNELQMKKLYANNPNMAAASMVKAQNQALVGAANNQGGMGAMGAFMGMNMVQNTGGGANPLGALQQQAPPPQAPQAAGWNCTCGATNAGRFCGECGSPPPAPAPAAGSWACACGTQNQGRFCGECGQPAPAAGWKCTCGAQNTGRFCGDCGASQG
ncbi:MAG: SPFH domain-containing protein [Defluviitaleaceae bacterium]|nr:SPFH domain-containing protein [Defluviitaleaceae bacterium]